MADMDFTLEDVDYWESLQSTNAAGADMTFFPSEVSAASPAVTSADGTNPRAAAPFAGMYDNPFDTAVPGRCIDPAWVLRELGPAPGTAQPGAGGPSIGQDRGGGRGLTRDEQIRLHAGIPLEDPQVTALRALARSGPIGTVANARLAARGELNTNAILRSQEVTGPLDGLLGIGSGAVQQRTGIQGIHRTEDSIRTPQLRRAEATQRPR
jgi:hypothetical protein